MTLRLFLAILLLGTLSRSAAGVPESRKDRPDAPHMADEPTKVHFFVFVLDIDDIDGAAQSFTANVFVRLHWKDERLAHSDESSRSFPLGEVWNPRLLLANKQGIVRKSLPQYVEVTPEGMVHYRQRYVGPLSQPLKLTEFPLDRHRFTIQFVAVGHPDDAMEFVPDVGERGDRVVGGRMADQLSLPDWEIEEFQALALPYHPIEDMEVPGFAFVFVARRHVLYYLWQVMVPLVVIVGMSWAAFWIDPRQAGVQIGVATSSILTLIAYRFVLAGQVPRLPYMTRMDYFTLGGTILVFAALVEVITTSYLARSNRAGLARGIDRGARWGFPTAFLLLLIWSMLLPVPG